MKKIFITGASGLLGFNWIKLTKKRFDIYISENKNFIRFKKKKKYNSSLFNKKKLSNFLKNNRINFFIHCAALSNIEFCEENKKKCIKLNVALPILLAKICKSLKIKFVFISSDHLFRGDNKLYKETSKTSPKNHYALSKVLAEKGILKVNKEALIIRTNFYGKSSRYKKSFSDKIFNSLKLNRKIKLFNDVYFTPILIDKLIIVIHKLIEFNKSGIFNITSNQRLSKYKFGLLIAKILKLKFNNIKKIQLEDLKNLTKRPKDMSLSNEKIKKIFPSYYFDIHKNLNELFKNEKNNYNWR